MAKAGSDKKRNLKFLRTGLTIGMHVGVAGEVIPLPSNDFFPPPYSRPLTQDEQLDYYGVVHYRLTKDEVNIGPEAKTPWQPKAEKPNPAHNPAPTIVQVGTPGKHSEEMGGGAATFTPSVPANRVSSNVPDPIAPEATEEEAEIRRPRHKKLKSKKKRRLEEAKATKMKARV